VICSFLLTCDILFIYLFIPSDSLIWILHTYRKYDCVLACGFWSTKVHVVFQFAEPSWNISPGKPALCSSLARLLAAAMFHVSYMFGHAWPSLQSRSAAGAMVASRASLLHYSFTDVTLRQVWSARLGRERSRPRGCCGSQHQHAAAAHRSADRQLDIVLPLFAGWPATFAWDAVQMWIVCGAATLAAAFSTCLGRSSGHQTLSHVTHCHGFQTFIHSLSWLVVLFVDFEGFFTYSTLKNCNVM